MKKTIFALATVALLSTGVSMAQRGYNPNVNRNPAPQALPGSRQDDIKEEIKIDRLDAIVNLSRKQEKEIKRIEDRYDKMEMASRQRRNPKMYQRFQAQKQQEILNVLTSKQREKWFAFQQSNRFDRGNGYGRRS
ncbi:hypothetical protein LX87_03490 [Larkinella arboricola]|uniref:Spy/CpxP family protein refolding chaperone n=1 Tax=Larkinella arboricola TaxID=643671 RepID=A0A327WST4_LARAB|nr:hypothetical protein [Larkinella arboricola]RAJ95742.1 hypothetical protein LX87_03490 [Larkinella arboricola]